MALVIQTNTAAITAQKNINTNTTEQNQALNRLSSGFRINSAADDSAGFAISSKLDATGARLKSAAQNATQAGALVKTAEAGVNEIQNMIVRLQSLAVQAASANNSQELTKLDAERTKLTNEIDNIANSTTFNGVQLLNGTGGSSGVQVGTFAAGAAVNTLAGSALITASPSSPNEVYKFTVDALGNVTVKNNANTLVSTGGVSFEANATKTLTLTDGAKISVSFGGTSPDAATDATLTVSGQSQYTTGAGANAAFFTASVTSSTGGIKSYSVVNTAGNAAGANITLEIKNGATLVGTTAAFTSGTASSQTLTLNDGNKVTVTYDGSATVTGAVNDATGTLLTADKSGSSGTVFQVGAENNASNRVSVNLGNSYTTAALNITGDISTTVNANAFIDTAKAALDTLITQRADLGATQNQLNFVSANLATSIEQITASVSSIRDADIAVEIANFTKSQILVQAGTAMLAQANQASQNVLRLFR